MNNKVSEKTATQQLLATNEGKLFAPHLFAQVLRWGIFVRSTLCRQPILNPFAVLSPSTPLSEMILAIE